MKAALGSGNRREPSYISARQVHFTLITQIYDFDAEALAWVGATAALVTFTRQPFRVYSSTQQCRSAKYPERQLKEKRSDSTISVILECISGDVSTTFTFSVSPEVRLLANAESQEVGNKVESTINDIVLVKSYREKLV